MGAMERNPANLGDDAASYRLLVENSREYAIFLMDLDARLVSWNPGVGRHFGYARDEWVGRPADIIFTPEDCADDIPAQEIATAREQGHADDIRWHLRKDGSVFWASGVVTSLRGDDGELLGYAKIVRDMSEAKEAEEEIQRLNAQLEQRVAKRTEQLRASVRELEAFAYSISHDLRAPLRGIDGFSLVLEEEYADALDADGRRLLQRVRAAAQRMGQLIDDLLDFSRLSRSDLHRTEVDLTALAENLVGSLEDLQPERDVTFEIQRGVTARGDERLLGIALYNLLENAWKFTARQEPARIEFGMHGGHGNRVYYVRDNGVGFDMRYVDRLFGPFQRLHPAGLYEGTGIGLATVQRIVSRHGGRIWAEAETGGGATFSFTLSGGDGDGSEDGAGGAGVSA